MRRTVLLLLALLMAMPNASQVIASGGNFAPPGVTVKLMAPATYAQVQINFAVNPPLGTVELRKGNLKTGQFSFNVSGPFTLGCVLQTQTYPNLTATRFLYAPLASWMPGTLVQEKYAILGVTVSPNLTPTEISPVPIIMDLENVGCSAPGSGTLNFDAVVLFEYQR
jgi:hypothetical protein